MRPWEIRVAPRRRSISEAERGGSAVRRRGRGGTRTKRSGRDPLAGEPAKPGGRGGCPGSGKAVTRRVRLGQRGLKNPAILRVSGSFGFQRDQGSFGFLSMPLARPPEARCRMGTLPHSRRYEHRDLSPPELRQRCVSCPRTTTVSPSVSRPNASYLRGPVFALSAASRRRKPGSLLRDKSAEVMRTKMFQRSSSRSGPSIVTDFSTSASADPGCRSGCPDLCRSRTTKPPRRTRRRNGSTNSTALSNIWSVAIAIRANSCEISGVAKAVSLGHTLASQGRTLCSHSLSTRDGKLSVVSSSPRSLSNRCLIHTSASRRPIAVMTWIALRVLAAGGSTCGSSMPTTISSCPSIPAFLSPKAERR